MLRTAALAIILILTIAAAAAAFSPRAAIAQDKGGDREERSTPSQPINLRLYEATTSQGDLEISFIHGPGSHHPRGAAPPVGDSEPEHSPDWESPS